MERFSVVGASRDAAEAEDGKSRVASGTTTSGMDELKSCSKDGISTDFQAQTRVSSKPFFMDSGDSQNLEKTLI